jgi:hypothetical protein
MHTPGQTAGISRFLVRSCRNRVFFLELTLPQQLPFISSHHHVG